MRYPPNIALVEPYYEPDGKLGYAVVFTDGRIEFQNLDQIYDLGEGLGKVMFLISEMRYWRFPKRPDMAALETRWRNIVEDPIIRDTPDSMEMQTEYVKTTLTDIMRRITGFLKRVFYFENAADYSLIGVYIIASYFRSQFELMPNMVYSATSGGGKTTLLKCINLLIYRGHMIGRYTAPYIRENVDDYDMSMILDEGLQNMDPSKNTGDNMLSLMLSAFDRDTAMWAYKDQKRNYGVAQRYFTSYVWTVRGDMFNEDARTRCMIRTLPPSSSRISGLNLIDLEDVREELGGTDLDPEGIRADLFALKLKTESERLKGIREQGVWFADFLNEAKQDIKQKDEYGQYLYGIKHNIPNAPMIFGRTRDFSNFFYMLGLATGTAREMMLTIIENDDTIQNFRTESIESVLHGALCNLIIREYSSGSLSGFPTITRKDLIFICRNIKLTDIWEEYANIRIEAYGWIRKDVEDPRTLAAKFRPLKIPYSERGGHMNFLDVNNPSEFVKRFKDALERFGCNKDKTFFEGL